MAGYVRTTARLADGRAIHYYDVPPAPPRGRADGRDLAVVATSSEVRIDSLRGEPVIIASHRQDRTFLPPAQECPLCPTAPGRLTEIPEPDYQVVIFDNRFPSLAPDAGGTCEVICYTSDHAASPASLTVDRVELILDACADRVAALGGLPGVEHVMVFENRGVEIGVTLTHPHGQIYAYPFVPPRDEQILARCREHRQETGRSLVGDLALQEESDGARLIASTEHWIAYVPHAARWPFEVRITPREQVPDLAGLSADQRRDAAGLYLDVMRAFDQVFDRPMPTITAWHQAPVHRDRDVAHLFCEVFSLRRSADRMKFLAGSEAAAGAWINDVTPEAAASLLRGA